jgi:uncharacterized protein with FMN-binding domain
MLKDIAYAVSFVLQKPIKKYRIFFNRSAIVKNLFVFSLLITAVLISSCKSGSFTEIKAQLPDMSGKSDGLYHGDYVLKGTPVKVAIDVTIKDENITVIKIVKHICSPIGKKAEKIIDKIIEMQSLNVDAVSGATGSSIAILKAVENALQ